MKKIITHLVALAIITSNCNAMVQTMQTPITQIPEQTSVQQKSLKQKAKEFGKEHKKALTIAGIVAGILITAGLGTLAYKKYYSIPKMRVNPNLTKQTFAIPKGVIKAEDIKANDTNYKRFTLNGIEYDISSDDIDDYINKYITDGIDMRQLKDDINSAARENDDRNWALLIYVQKQIEKQNKK